MSRICGIVRAGQTAQQCGAAIQRLIHPQLHSSDYSSESWVSDEVALGRTFFKTYNFSTHLHCPDGAQVICAFSGYFRDLAALRRRAGQGIPGGHTPDTPAEALALLWPRHGASLLPSLSGSYVFALWEAQARRLTLGTDRYGMIPLYYAHRGAQLLFASEIKAIQNLESDFEVDLAAWREIVALGHPLADATVYPSIRRLPPATVLTFQYGQLSSQRYWWYDQLPATPRISVPEFVDTAQQLLSRSVTALVEQVEKPICMLSAGYDSRRVFLELVRHSRQISAYTAPTVHPDGGFTYDVPIARALCAKFGVPHYSVGLPTGGQGGRLARYASRFLDFGTGSHAWVLPLLSEMPTASGVNFDGLGGDILFESNFVYEPEATHSGDAVWLADAVLSRFPDLWSAHFRLPVDGPPLLERITELLLGLPPSDHRYTLFYFTNWTRRMTSLFSYGLLSLKMDSVFPFLDYDLVDFLFSLAPLTKRTTEVSRLMLEKRDPQLAEEIPTSHYPEIYIKPDTCCRPFCQPLPPDYYLKERADIYRAAAADVFAGGRLLGNLSRHAQMAAMAVWLSRFQKATPLPVTRRAWPLFYVGQYALQQRVTTDPDWATEHLAEAREYLFSGHPSHRP